jgi:ankyrin repeat protein
MSAERLLKGAKNGDIDEVISSINKGIYIDTRNEGILIDYTEWGQLLEKENSLDIGARLDCQDEWGATGLMIAAKNGHISVVATFLENGSDANAIIHSRNRYGRTALMMAAQKNHPRVVETLLENGADVEAKN